MTLWQELVRRAAVGAVALPVVGTLLWLGGPWSAARFAVGGAIGAYEYYRMTRLREAAVRWIGAIAAAVLPAIPWSAGAHWPEAAPAIIAASSIAAWTWLLLQGPRSEAPTNALSSETSERRRSIWVQSP